MPACPGASCSRVFLRHDFCGGFAAFWKAGDSRSIVEARSRSPQPGGVAEVRQIGHRLKFPPGPPARAGKMRFCRPPRCPPPPGPAFRPESLLALLDADMCAPPSPTARMRCRAAALLPCACATAASARLDTLAAGIAEASRARRKAVPISLPPTSIHCNAKLRTFEEDMAPVIALQPDCR